MTRPIPARLLAAFAAASVASPAIADARDDGIVLEGATARVTLDYVSQYFFRGIEQLDSDTGAVLQPGAELTLPVVDATTATIGTWGSIHTDGSGQPAPAGASNPKAWFEQRVYASLNHTAGPVALGIGVTHYTFPSRTANGDITELNLSVAFDDADLFGDFAFQPYVAVAIELQNNAFPDENSYLEVGGAFRFDMAEAYDLPIVWSVPIAAGFSLDDYYTDASGANESFGFVSIGLFGEVPLSELLGTDQWLGAWDLTAGVTVVLLNSSVIGLTDNFSGSSDNVQVFATLGIRRAW